MICGDFNFDQSEENALTRMLRHKKFKQIVTKPTTYRGYCIDHFYHNLSQNIEMAECMLRYCYFSDHEAVCVKISDT